MTTPAPRKALGQHFLFDRSILRRIVEAAGVEAGQTVLEIGPGPGGLTRALLEAGARVWALEADPRMVEHLDGEDFGEARERLKVFRSDALEADYLALAREAGRPLSLVANLPYNISGPLLARLLRQRRAFSALTLMLQREVAERLAAPPGSRARGRLSALAQCFCRVRPLFRVPAGAFRPPPRVESMVVRLEVLPEPVRPLVDEEALWGLVKMGFGQRRKMLRNGLRPLEDRAAPVLAAAGLTGSERPEALASESWISLANALAACRPAAEG